MLRLILLALCGVSCGTPCYQIQSSTVGWNFSRPSDRYRFSPGHLTVVPTCPYITAISWDITSKVFTDGDPYAFSRGYGCVVVAVNAIIDGVSTLLSDGFSNQAVFCGDCVFRGCDDGSGVVRIVQNEYHSGDISAPVELHTETNGTFVCNELDNQPCPLGAYTAAQQATFTLYVLNNEIVNATPWVLDQPRSFDWWVWLNITDALNSKPDWMELYFDVESLSFSNGSSVTWSTGRSFQRQSLRTGRNNVTLKFNPAEVKALNQSIRLAFQDVGESQLSITPLVFAHNSTAAGSENLRMLYIGLGAGLGGLVLVVGVVILIVVLVRHDKREFERIR